MSYTFALKNSQSLPTIAFLKILSLVLGFGLYQFCPWPREGLYLKSRSLVLASDFFSVLGLEHCVLDSRSASNIEHVTCNLNVMIDDHDNENNLYQCENNLYQYLYQCDNENNLYQFICINAKIIIKKV